jgi:hypothetical protein
MDTIIQNVIHEYGFESLQMTSRPFGSGHINTTYLISPKGDGQQFILQSINQNVFKDPLIIAENVRLVGSYLKKHYPKYLFVDSVPTNEGKEMAYIEETYWRLTRFIPNSVAFDTLSDPQQAFEAAEQFGKLSKLLDGFDASLLKPSIPGFHDLNLRYRQFKEAVEIADLELLTRASSQIEKALL